VTGINLDDKNLYQHIASITEENKIRLNGLGKIGTYFNPPAKDELHIIAESDASM
jgi:hypothetical protein